MNSKQALLALLHDRPVAYHPVLVRVTGSVSAGLFLSQLLYWHGKGSDQEGWIYKTRDEIAQETGLTRREQEGARKRLRDQGVVEEQLKGLPATVHYRVNIERLSEVLAETTMNLEAVPTSWHQTYQLDGTKCTNLLAQNRPTITESTTESTTENNDSCSDSGPVPIDAIVLVAESVFGTLNYVIAQQLTEARTEYGDEWVKAALEEAALANIRRWRYVEAILERWKRDGFRSTNGAWPQKGGNHGQPQGPPRQVSTLRQAGETDFTAWQEMAEWQRERRERNNNRAPPEGPVPV